MIIVKNLYYHCCIQSVALQTTLIYTEHYQLLPQAVTKFTQETLSFKNKIKTPQVKLLFLLFYHR